MGNTIVILTSVIVLVCVMILLHNFGSQIVDDGYYYLEVARNISSGNGFTFDRINRTNGFHPLWQMLLVPLFWIFSGSSSVAIAATVVQTLFFAGCGYILYRLVYSLTESLLVSTGAAVFWLLNFWFWSKGALSGMETGILLFCFGASLILFVRVLRGTCSPWLLSAALLAASMARLDTLALATGTVIVFILLKEYRKALISGLPIAAYLPAYMIINRLWFGGCFPVSGYIKSAFGRELINRLFTSGDISFFRHGFANIIHFASLGDRIPPLLLLIPGAAFIWLLVRYWKKSSNTVSKSMIAVILIYIVCLMGYYSFMYRSLTDVYTYYWYPSIFGSIVIFFLFLSRIKKIPVRYGVTGIIFAGLIFFDIAYAGDRFRSYSFMIPDSERAERAGVDFLNENLDDGAIIGCWDAGYVGYHCRHRVINLDGLVNSYEYQEILKNSGLAQYIEMENITFLANTDYFSGKREFIESLDGWSVLFEDSTEFPAAVSMFTISDSGRDYASRCSRIFYIYGKL